MIPSNSTEATAALEQAVAYFEQAGVGYDALRAQLSLATVLQLRGQHDAADAELDAVIRNGAAMGAESLVAQARQRTARPPISAKTLVTPFGLTITARERDVLVLLVSGLTNRQIAARLGVSQHTVHRHVANVFAKLGVSSRTAAVTAAIPLGISAS